MVIYMLCSLTVQIKTVLLLSAVLWNRNDLFRIRLRIFRVPEPVPTPLI